MKIERLAKTWGIFELEEDKYYFTRIGDCEVWLKIKNSEIYITYQHTYQATEEYELPDHLIWNRFITGAAPAKIELKPVLPDRALFVKPEQNFYLTGNSEATVFIRIPVWIAIGLVDGKGGNPLLELPSLVLSNTWFGDFYEGQLCYWLSSGARFEMEPDPSRPFMAISRLTIRNKSKDTVFIDKLLLKSVNFSLFESDNQLWTDRMIIVFEGFNDVSEILFTGKAEKDMGKDVKLIAPPRTKLKKGFFKEFNNMVTHQDSHVIF